MSPSRMGVGAGLLTSGSSPCGAGAFPCGGAIGGSPVTVARPCWICSSFPVAPSHVRLDFRLRSRLPVWLAEKRAAVQYFEPNFVDEALVLLDRFAPAARVLAGGTLLGPEVRRGDSNTSTIVNIKRIPELGDIGLDGAVLRVGALVTAAELAADDMVRRYAPLVALAAGTLGARQLRNVATIGGNLCSTHPAADLVVALLASDARCVVADIVAGPASITVDEFLQLVTSRDPRTLLTAVEIPATPLSISYQKMQTRRAFEMALVAVGVAVHVEGGTIRHARVALGGVAPSVVRAPNAEAALLGKRADEETARVAARIAAAQDTRADDDPHASAEYRRHLVAVLCGRALRDAFAQPPRIAN